MAQAPWANDPIVTDRPQQQASAPPHLVQIAPPQPNQPPGQTGDQAALTAEQLRAARIANDVNEGVNIPGDPTKQGPEYLATIPQADQEQVRALSEGRIPWPTGRAASSPYWQRIIAATGHYDPSFDAANYATRVQTRRAFAAGGRRRMNITSFNTVLHHIDALREAADALHNGDFPILNSILNRFSNAFGSGRPLDFDTAATAVSDEMEAALVNSGGTLAGRQGWRDLLSSSASPEQFQMAFRRMAGLLHDRVQEIGEEYNAGMGRSDDPLTLLSPDARASFYRIQGIPPPADNAGPDAGAPPTAGGPPAGGAPPPPNPAAPTAGGGPGPAIVAASSDTPPSEAVSPHYVQMAQQAQALFNQGATREQMDAWAVRHGLQPYGHDLDRAIQYRDRGGRGARILPPETVTPAGAVARQLDMIEGTPGLMHRAGEGFTQGLNDEISGVARSVGNVVSSPFTGDFDPIGSYQVGRDAERIRNTEAEDNTGGLGTAVEVGSSLLGAAPAFVATGPAEAAGLGGRMLSSARTGAAFGAGSGWAHGEGLGGSMRGAAVGGAEGAALGGTLPVVGATLRLGGRAAQSVYRTALGENPDLARRIVARAIAADTPNGFNPVARVSGQLADAHANDVPAILADTGGNARGLLAAAARAPGPTREAAGNALEARQAGMVGRVTAAIERDLGPIANPHEVADTLMTQARDTAAPLYDAAYARPGADTFAQRVAPLLARPSMQRALQRASRIAAEEGRDPSTSGFDVNSSGEVTVSRTPSWQTLDYVKRGLDDVVETYRDPTSGRLNLDTEGRAINNTLRSFLSAFDQANPDYAAARAAYGGQVRGIDAMNAGRQALGMTADDLEARMRDMTPYERQMFQLGTRRAMAELVASRGDTADVVNALAGTGKKRAMLARLFGDRQSFQRFVDTLGHEQEAFRTFRGARLGSPTAQNLQDDNALRDAAPEALTDIVLSGGTHVLPSILRFVTRLGRNRLDDNTAQELTALLSESDPARLRELAGELRQEQTRQAVLSARRARRARVGGAVTGQAAGRAQRN